MAAIREVSKAWRPISLLPRSFGNGVRPYSTGGGEPPNGFLFNEKPLLPGEKRKWESWEKPWYIGMGLNFLLVLGICIWKPNTSVSSWGHQKALQRLEGDSTSESTE
ncbi:PREDICTED: uncharacterized protein LOC100641872 [Amphimedon queenslandica]|uniref:Complex I-ESSS n=1 Tax=Amphimedon queenslandica TaxID=400682 RepID=A0A1X7VQE0_AMPQE|nr:PREDICTED: uncharacterized protein LOC100641872 [Amphimedon queenslandica]|eukprot:XP_003382981.1 PREDICTED: uncharacterized protein LOC100641872 [Amphimedon queenslandica]